jgi:small-conductance mechanosensitive channel
MIALLILTNLGIKVTPLLASLGVIGIAVSFALKNILEDLFASISIYLDKPFRIGDYIAMGEHSGSVEHVGIKTTRIRTIL